MYYCKECGELIDDPQEDNDGFLFCPFCASIDIKFLDEDKYKSANEGY